MNYIVIDFPFSSLHESKYHLVLTLNGDNVAAALSGLDADNEVFTPGLVSHDGNDTVYHYQGTLTGSVKAADDERDDYLEPLVCSKLAFNIAVQTFPTWLIAFCNTTRAKAVIYYAEGVLKHEMWRGYLVGQTLNMTVVNNLLSVSLVAVDEVAMAKYMNFKETVRHVSDASWCSLFDLMEIFYSLHYVDGLADGTPGFSWVYNELSMSHTGRMLWHRDLCLTDDEDTEVTDLPSTLTVNLDRWLQDKEATWKDVLDDVLRYLGVTFAVGSYGNMTVNDAYLLTCPCDVATVRQYVYTFVNHTIVSHNTDQYATLDNPSKVGANLQITTEPDRYRKVIVTSKPERWAKHEYLTKEHYPEIDKTKFVRYEWGITDNATNGPFTAFGWRKMRYLKPDSEEADFLTLEPCTMGEGYLMARSGILPCDDISSCDGKTEPDASVADSLDFITFMEGCCCIMMGGGDLGGDNEDKQLNPYFLLMNHMWDNMFNRERYTMQNMHVADTPWVGFRPLGSVAGVHPSEKHYLQISMNVVFIRENMPVGSRNDGNPNQHTWFAAPNNASAMRVMDWQSPAMLMPSPDTYFDFANDSGPCGSEYCANLQTWSGLNFKAYIRIGNHYYNGSYWEYVASGSTPPKCTVTLYSSTSETEEITKMGVYMIATKNYYYTISNPWRNDNTVERNSNPKMRGSLDGVSIHGFPVDGKLEMQILGQVDFINANSGVYNSIPYILINNVQIGYTDDAEMLGKDITNTHTQIVSMSPTKEELKRDVKMASPMVPGFFNNALLYDGGKSWHNLQKVKMQSGLPLTAPPEWFLLQRLAAQYGAGQMYVELDTPVAYDDNVHNVCFRVTHLTEAYGSFLPVKREFDYTKDLMHVKLMRINDSTVN